MFRYSCVREGMHAGFCYAILDEMAAFVFFFQAEDGIRGRNVTGVQTCALPIWNRSPRRSPSPERKRRTWCQTSPRLWRPPFHRHDGTAAEALSVSRTNKGIFSFCPTTVVDMSMLSTPARTLGTRSHRS